MFYRWVRRLESMQIPATGFPAADGDPAVESEDSLVLDGALMAAALASLWVLFQSMRHGGSGAFFNPDRAVLSYGPVLLIGVLAALLLRPQVGFRALIAHVVAYCVVAVVIAVAWVAVAQHSVFALPTADVLVWATVFALLGLVTTVLCLVAWATALRLLATPRTYLHDHANQFRMVCVALIVLAALIGAHKAVTIPFLGY
jgi:hypothetical protein